MGRPLRVLIVDDSALMRHRLSGIIGAAPGYEVAGRAANGEECLAQLPTLQPDVVTLDVEMPGMDGLTTLRHIMAARPTPTIMVSSLTEAGARTTLDALSLGAVDYLTKPASGTLDRTAAFRDELLRKLAMAATARLPRVVPGTLRLAPVVSGRPSPLAREDVRARWSLSGVPLAVLRPWITCSAASRPTWPRRSWSSSICRRCSRGRWRRAWSGAMACPSTKARRASCWRRVKCWSRRADHT